MVLVPATNSLIEAIHLAARSASRADKLRALEQRRALFLEQAYRLNERLKDGRIPILVWNVEMRDLIKDLHIAAYAIGRSGEWSAITPREWNRNVASVNREQYAYLRSWAAELYRTLETTSLAQLNARVKLYAAAATQSFERGYAAEVGIEAILPAWPGDGTTACRSNCRCRWAIRVISKARGDYDCTWTLGPAEHCRTCRKRAKAWKKLRIRGGVLVDGYEPIFE